MDVDGNWVSFQINLKNVFLNFEIGFLNLKKNI